MPTGVHIQDPREQLFAAAERILLHDGPDALTSRAVTAQAGCAKGVLHRYFESFDAFLAEFVLDRIERMKRQGAELMKSAGTGIVIDNLTVAATRLFGPLAVSIVALVTFQNEVRIRLREARSIGGLPVLSELTAIFTGYLDAERTLGRVTADTDVGVLAPTLVGALHLLFAGSDAAQPEVGQVREVVTTVLAGVLAPR